MAEEKKITYFKTYRIDDLKKKNLDDADDWMATTIELGWEFCRRLSCIGGSNLAEPDEMKFLKDTWNDVGDLTRALEIDMYHIDGSYNDDAPNWLTERQKQRLRDEGYTEEEISHMRAF